MSANQDNNTECRCCDGLMRPTKVRFTVVKESAVYVINDVPSLQCAQCGETVYDGEAVSKLERLTSGRIVAKKMLNAWVYNWDDVILEIRRDEIVSSTEINDVIRADTLVPLSA